MVAAGALMLLVAVAAGSWPAIGAGRVCRAHARLDRPLPHRASCRRPRPPVVRVVQPNLAEEERPTDDYAENNFQALARLSRRTDPGAPPRLIVWPEGAIRFPLEDGYPRYVYIDRGSATDGAHADGERCSATATRS